MNPRSLKATSLITAALFAIALSLVHAPNAFAGGASGAPGVFSDRGGAGMVSRNAKIRKLEMEVIQARLNVFQAELTVAQLQLLSGYISIVGSLLTAGQTSPLSTAQTTVLQAGSAVSPIIGPIDFVMGWLAIENAEFSP